MFPRTRQAVPIQLNREKRPGACPQCPGQMLRQELHVNDRMNAAFTMNLMSHVAIRGALMLLVVSTGISFGDTPLSGGTAAGRTADRKLSRPERSRGHSPRRHSRAEAVPTACVVVQFRAGLSRQVIDALIATCQPVSVVGCGRGRIMGPTALRRMPCRFW